MISHFLKIATYTLGNVTFDICFCNSDKIFAAVTWGPLMHVKIQTGCSYNRLMANVSPLIII
jgi:hypothetical protein